MPALATPLRLFRMAGLALVAAAIGLVLSLGLSDRADAVPAPPDPYVDEQPDGGQFIATAFGDEWYNGVETVAGFTVLQNPASEWTYAVPEPDGSLIPGDAVVGEDRRPAEIEPHLRDAVAESAREEIISAEEPPSGAPGTPSYAPVAGTQKVLVILAQFSNQTNKGTTAASWNAKYFGATDSADDYYNEVSYGQFRLAPATEGFGTANDGVVGWVTLPGLHPNTAGSTSTANQEIVRKAIVAADNYVNYAAYDTNGNGVVEANELHITVIVAGYEAATGGGPGLSVWGHKWSVATPDVRDGKYVGVDYTQFGEMQGNHQATIGIIVHELGHDIGLPDLYGDPATSNGIGDWSVMSYGSWGATAGEFAGQTPVHPDVWSKWTKGWISPTVINGAQNVGIRASASTTKTSVAVQMLSNPGGADWKWPSWNGYDWVSSASGQYFLAENRQAIPGTYDEGIPGSGMIVYHIDEAQPDNFTDATRIVDVEEADGFRELDYTTSYGDGGDPFPGTGNKRSFTSATNPSSALANGSASGVSITNISNSALTMTATFTAPVSMVRATPPRTPVAVAGNREARVTWVAPLNAGGTPITGYTVTSAPGVTGKVTTCSTTALSCVVKNLTNGVAYTFTVKAVNAVGTSAASVPSAAVIPKLPSFTKVAPPTVKGVPAVGSTLTATRGTWSGVAGMAGVVYTDQWNRNGAPITGANSLTYKPVAADAGATLTYIVKLTAPGYTATAAASSNVVIPKYVLTASPTIAARGILAGGLAVESAPTLDFVAGTAGNGLTMTATINGTKVGSAVITSGTASIPIKTSLVPSLAAGRVDLVLSVPASARTAALVRPLTIVIVSRPSAPLSVAALAGSERVTVSWAAPTSNGGKPIASYTVSASPARAGFATTCTTTGTSCTVANLLNGTAYRFTVTATNAIGTSIPSVASAPVIPHLPSFAVSVPPTLTGPVVVGLPLTAARGTYAGAAGATYAYQWTGDGVAIAGATALTYTPQAADVGTNLQLVVTVSGAGYAPTPAATAPTTVPLIAPVVTPADPDAPQAGIAAGSTATLDVEVGPSLDGLTVTATLNGVEVGSAVVAGGVASIPIDTALAGVAPGSWTLTLSVPATSVSEAVSTAVDILIV